MCFTVVDTTNNPTVSHIYWWPPTSDTSALNWQHDGANTTTGSSARCCATSHSTGPSPTGVKATHGTSPDNRLHRTDSLACSHTGPHGASPDNNRLPRMDSLPCSLVRSLHNSRQLGAQDRLTCLQLHQTTPRISTDRLLRHPNASSRPPVPHFSSPYGQPPHRTGTTPAAQHCNPPAH